MLLLMLLIPSEARWVRTLFFCRRGSCLRQAVNSHFQSSLIGFVIHSSLTETMEQVCHNNSKAITFKF